MPDVTAVLVNWHSLDNIRARLASAALKDQRVVVVDNNDDPQGVIAACREHGNAIPLLLEENFGFAIAVNRAVDAVAGEAEPLLLLNPDAYISPEALTAMVDELRRGADGVGPLLIETGRGRIQIGSGGGPLTLRSVAYYFLFLSQIVPWLRGMFLTRRQLARATDVDWLCMACLLVQPNAFNRFGAIPEDELVYAEDIAWGTLASKQGARFRQLPDVKVLHESGGSGGRRQWIGALERLCRRRLGPIRGALAVAAIRLGLAVRRLMGRQVT